jgi:hypothetical protein
MSILSRTILASGALTAALCIPSAGAADASADRPGDAAMTCEQIAAELSPYVQQMLPNLQALASSEQQVYQQARQMGEKRRVENAMLTPMATAGALDPTGASKRAYQAALMAQHAKEQGENQAFLNSSVAQQNKADTEQFMAQAQQMQSDARLQRLMQMGQEKHCDRR